MSLSEAIALISSFISLLTLGFLAKQIAVQNKQLTIQNNLYKGQLLKDRFEMYFGTFYTPISREYMEEVQTHPEDFFYEKIYQSYKDDYLSLCRYIRVSKTYEYLALCYALKVLKLEDPFSSSNAEPYIWINIWVSAALKEQKEFVDAHEFHKRYYPDFGSFVDEIAASLQDHSACVSR